MGRVSAYFVFTRQAREEVKESLLESGAKAGVTDVAKALGVRWRALSEEERAAFKQRAEQEAAAAAAADPEGGANAAGDGGDGASAPQPPISQLPLARVGRIMKMDKEVGRYSKEALLLTAVATEAFLSGLTDHAAAAAKSAGRRTIKINDVAEVCARRENDRLHFLVDVMKSMAGEVAEAAAVANASKPGRRAPSDGAEGERVGDGEEGGEPATGADTSKRGKKVDRAPTLPKMKSMTDFFTKHRGPAPPPPERTSEDDEEDDFAAYEGATDDEEGDVGFEDDDAVLDELVDDDEEVRAAAEAGVGRRGGRGGATVLDDDDEDSGSPAQKRARDGPVELDRIQDVDTEPSHDVRASEVRPDLTMESEDDDADLLEEIYPDGEVKQSPGG